MESHWGQGQRLAFVSPHLPLPLCTHYFRSFLMILWELILKDLLSRCFGQHNRGPGLRVNHISGLFHKLTLQLVAPCIKCPSLDWTVFHVIKTACPLLSYLNCSHSCTRGRDWHGWDSKIYHHILKLGIESKCIKLSVIHHLSNLKRIQAVVKFWVNRRPL